MERCSIAVNEWRRIIEGEIRGSISKELRSKLKVMLLEWWPLRR